MNHRGQLGVRACRAFTLVELLVVVVIIAAVATVAMMRISDAQARSKVSRSRNDMRVIVGAIELYVTDNGTLPPENELGLVPRELTTPVAYMEAGQIWDIMEDHTTAEGLQNPQWTNYRFNSFMPSPDPNQTYWRDIMRTRHGSYWVYGQGPALAGFREAIPGTPFIDTGLYDPTNGIVSWGKLIRSQKWGTESGNSRRRA
ncbi:MAG: prepilin-type N-terminal cleavage/methylation domain-containing protein [Candidatus Sumerlaeaceae bacterium]|nr:prepilin-type N-terminal cleavage/methylation domain-containing protein [Candidatus Sumerlaeaceae bacterium]